MAKIIQFGNPPKDARNGGSSDGTKFGLVESDGIEHALLNLPAAYDWDNQELADLYRVRQLLEDAGVHIDVDRGVTDEGDPWFVFCQSDGEVFVHLCRIDGVYLLDSPNMGTHLTGSDFRTLINSFVERAAARQSNANVVPFRPKNGVHLHPAILLTVLIWSLYLESDELVGIAHADDTGASGFNLEDVLGPKIVGSQTITQALEVLEEKDSQSNGNDTGIQSSFSGFFDPRNAASTIQGVTASQTIALSLTALAVTFGILNHSSFELVDASNNETQSSTLLEDAQLVLPGQIELPDEERSDIAFEESQQDLQIAKSDAETIVEVVNLVSGDAIGQNVEVSVPVTVQTHEMETQISFSKDARSNEQTNEQPRETTIAPVEQVEVEQVEVEQVQNKAVTITIANIADGLGERLGINASSIKDLSSYKLDGLSLTASFDIDSNVGRDILSSLNGGGLGLLPIELSAGDTDSIETDIGFNMYSDLAKQFVDFLLSKGNAIEIVATSQEIVFLDMTAFDDATDVTHTQSWTFEDGGTISTIGHLHEFIEFGLIS